MEQAFVGCDEVVFYSGPQFKGLPNQPPGQIESYSVSPSQFNSATFKTFPTGFSPQSFQAFKKGEDGSKIPCGSTGCGCSVILCIQKDPNKCAADQDSVIAYEPIYQDTEIALSYIVKNPADKNSAANSIITNLQSFWNLITQ